MAFLGKRERKYLWKIFMENSFIISSGIKYLNMEKMSRSAAETFEKHEKAYNYDVKEQRKKEIRFLILRSKVPIGGDL